MKLGMISLGCPKNLVDSEVMLGILREANYELTNQITEAEIVIVNTCGFIQSAKEESITTILETASLKKTGKCKYILVAGCLVQRYAEDLLEDMPEIDGIIGTNCFTDIAFVLEEVKHGKRPIHLQKKPEIKTDAKRVLCTPKHFAYLKIAEGCDNHCSYCVIPKIRGRYKSRKYEEVLEEAKYLATTGIKELIVVAQDTTRYGEDLYGRLRLAELLKDLCAIPQLQWVRVMYMYPNNFNDELIHAFATLPKLCKYIDIPIQHASDKILKSMNRRDTQAEIISLLAKLRKQVTDIVIRTTFIVGYPGETEKDFQTLKKFIGEEKFENAGVFQYSQEEGTFAGKMANQIAAEVKEKRYDELMAIQAKISENCHKATEGKIYDVIVEGFDEEDNTLAFGRSYREAPDIDGLIFIENAQKLKVGDMVKVKILQGFTYESVGQLIV